MLPGKAAGENHLGKVEGEQSIGAACAMVRVMAAGVAWSIG